MNFKTQVLYLKRLLGPETGLKPAGEKWMIRDLDDGRAQMEAARGQLRIAEAVMAAGETERAWFYLARALSSVVRAQQMQLDEPKRLRLFLRRDIGGRPSALEQALYLHELAALETGGKTRRARAAIARNEDLRKWYGAHTDDGLRKALRAAEAELKRD